ncbi:MAG: Trk system potassium transporter TrkA [Kiritimatiellae bacterium]|nr:Trk system potassium transporter TrkA [Kiritimatiellia bacterium]
MRILILGAGTSGHMLASRLCADNQDVTLIDKNLQALERVEAGLDLLTIHGDATDPRILDQAGISKSDMVVAVTDQESVNILACALAHISGVPKKIARVSNPAYTNVKGHFNLKQLGIDLVVNQQQECAKDLYNILRIPGAQEAVDLLDGRILCAGFLLPTDCPLIMCPLKDHPQHELLSTIRFVAYNRGDKIRIPRGETQFQVGDLAYVIGEPEPVKNFMQAMQPSETGYSRLVIAGGGELGMQLAMLLGKTSLDITLVEENPDRADYCSEALDRTLIINGSSLNQELMEELGINAQTAFAAVTGDDENNIMSCLVAEKMGAHFTIARVDKHSYHPIVNSLSLVDRLVSPHSSLINSIYHFVRGNNVRGDRMLQKIPGEIMEVTIGEDHPWANRKVINIKLPRGCIISTVLSDKLLRVATGETAISIGARVLIYGLPKYLRKLDDIVS